MPYDEKTTNLAEDLNTTSEDQLKQAYREASGYDLRDGSTTYQLFVGRIADILSPAMTFISNILGSLNTNMSTTYDTFIDILASVFLMTRDEGGSSTGSVYMVFSDSLTRDIPAGTIFISGSGLQYRAVRTQVIVSTQYTAYRGNYRTPAIYLEAVAPGAEYDIGANEVSGTQSVFQNLVSIYNSSAFTGGSDRETNTELLQRMRDSVSSRTLSNYPGIRYVLKSLFSTIDTIEIVGSGDAEMERDKIYASTSQGGLPLESVDFARKIYASTAEERSKALVTFSDSKSPGINVDGNDIADVEGFNTEFSQEEYNQIGGLDANLVEFGADVILDETWTPSVATSDVTPWYCAETNDQALRRWADWALIENGYLVLGSKATTTNARTLSHVVSSAVSTIGDFLTDFLNSPGYKTLKRELDQDVREYGPKIQGSSEARRIAERDGDGAESAATPEYQTIDGLLKAFIENELSGADDFGTSVMRTNLSPVVQIPLAQQKGIVINGSFNFVDDDLAKVKPLYITNFRANASNPKAHDGFGIAVYPTIEAGRSNLMITDNNSISDDYFIAGSDFHAESISENFLKGTELSISVNTEYNYELIYGVANTAEEDAVTLEVRIWAASGSRPAPATLTYGAYVPMNLRAENIVGQAQSIEATDFGFGIMETEGFTWNIGPVKIVQGTTVYAQILYMMDATSFAGENIEAYIGHRGVGSDSGVQTYGSEVKIIDFDTPSAPVWESVESNLTGAVNFSKKVFDVDRYSDADNYLFLLITTAYPYDGVNDINSIVESDYVSISRAFEGYHVGSKIDIYPKLLSDLHTPESQVTVDLAAGTGLIPLSTENGFVNPITRIISVEILDGSMAPTGVLLTEYTDFRMMSVVQNEDLSTRENKVLVMTNFAQVYNIRVTCGYIPTIDAIQSYVDDQTVRGTRSDILVKQARPKYISIAFTATYNGSDFIDAIKEYIYGATEKVRSFDLVAIAADYGLESANLSSFVLSSVQYDADGNKLEESSTEEITKTRVEVFIPEDVTITV